MNGIVRSIILFGFFFFLNIVIGLTLLFFFFSQFLEQRDLRQDLITS